MNYIYIYTVYILYKLPVPPCEFKLATGLIVVGALGAITTRFEKFILEAGTELRVEPVQKTVGILRSVFGS